MGKTRVMAMGFGGGDCMRGGDGMRGGSGMLGGDRMGLGEWSVGAEVGVGSNHSSLSREGGS